MTYKVPYIGVGSSWDEKEKDAVIKAMFDPNTLSEGPELAAFEEEFRAYIGSKYAFSVTNCTIALEMATYLVDLKEGDEVIATPFSYQASIQPLLVSPARIRFCDINPNTLCADPKSIEAIVTDRTKAIYITHYGGFMADMDAIMALAETRGIIVVEDCAHAPGSSIRGKKAGVTGHIGCFSFQSYKNMSTLGEGGIITFNNDKWAEIISRIRSIEPDAQFIENPNIRFGKYRLPNYPIFMHEKNAFTHDCTEIRHAGTNSTMNEAQAAAGRIQLSKLDEVNRRRAYIADTMDTVLNELPGIRTQYTPKEHQVSHHLYSFFLDPALGLDRDRIAYEIDQEGVEIVLRYFPLHLLPEWRFRGGKYGDCPVCENIWFEQLINLPIYPTMTEKQLQFMCTTVVKVLRRYLG